MDYTIYLKYFTLKSTSDVSLSDYKVAADSFAKKLRSLQRLQ